MLRLSIIYQADVEVIVSMASIIRQFDVEGYVKFVIISDNL
jgi:hypothetical protein